MLNRTYGELSRSAKRVGDAARRFDSAAEHFERLGLRDDTGRMYALTGSCHSELGEHEAAVCAYKKRLASFEKAGNERGRALAELDLGEALYRMECYQEAIPMLQRAGERSQRVGEAANAGWSFDRLGHCHLRLEQEDEALVAFRHALEQFESVAHGWGIAVSNQNIGRCLRRHGRLEQAASHLRAAADHFAELSKPEKAARAYFDAAICYRDLQQPEDALGMFVTAAEFFRSLGDRKSVVYCDQQMGLILQRLERFAEAADRFEAAAVAAHELVDPNLAHSLVVCGHGYVECQVRLKNLDLAEAFHTRYLLFGDSSAVGALKDVADAAAHMASELEDRGDFEEALWFASVARDYYARALEMTRPASMHEGLRDAADVWWQLGGIHSKLKRYKEASDCYERSLSAWRAIGDETKLAESCYQYAMTVFGLGDLELFMRASEKALAMLERAGEDHCQKTFMLLNGQMQAAHQLGDDAALWRALGQLQRVLHEHHAGCGNVSSSAISELIAVFGGGVDLQAEEDKLLRLQQNDPRSVAVASQHRTLATHLQYVDDEQALSHLQRASELYVELGDKWGQQSCKISQAEILSRLGRHAEAKASLSDALRLYSTVAANRPPDLVFLHSVAVVLSRGRDAELRQVLASELSRQDKELHSLLAMSSTEDLLRYGEVERGLLDLALSAWGHWCSSSSGTTADGVAREAVSWVLRRKGMTFEGIANTQRARLLAGSDDELRNWIVDLEIRRAELARRPYAAEATDGSSFDAPECERLCRDLERKISQRVHTRRALGEQASVDLRQLKKRMVRGTVLVEYIVANWFSMEMPGLGSAVHAENRCWAIVASASPDDESGVSTRLFDLGDASIIESAIADFRRGVGAGEAMALVDARGVARLLWDPIAEAVGDAEHVIISPDGALWLVPFEALVLEDGRYLIEEKQISYVISGRYLVGQDEEESGARGAVVLAAPDYDLELAAAVSASQPALEEARYSGALGGARFGELPGSGREAQSMRPQLAKLLGDEELQVLTGAVATEAAFKAVARPRVLVLSTHGFFLQDQDYSAGSFADRSPLSRTLLLPPVPATTQPAVEIENPLVRCGLALAGANNRASAPPGADDGILTGLEIVGADLRGTELVVLSACETGVGEIQVGEGVAGLRQAFQLAGAQTVVSSLWKVPDAETADLMTWFFENLANGQGRSQALRNAQLRMIEQLREKRGRAHPLYWAAFTLTGKS